MKIRFQTLTLQCKKSREVIDLSHHISFFHGMIGSGKSSLVRLINYCLGGGLEMTPAIRSELISVSLLSNIGEYEVLLERERGSDNIQAAWKDAEGNAATVLAPKSTRNAPIWKNVIFNLSDLLFYLMGIDPIKVHKSKLQDDSPLIRLSFRDFMWYCYLDQDHLDSSFFRLEDPVRGPKSRDVMRYFVGYYSEKLNSFQIELENTRDERTRKLDAVKELKYFLKKFGYGSAEEIQKEIDETKTELEKYLIERDKTEKGYAKETHIGDELRKQLRQIGETLYKEETAFMDLEERVEDQTSLRAELLSSKFKLARSQSVSNVLSKVDFNTCPNCGSDLERRTNIPQHSCKLCGSDTLHQKSEIAPQAESIRLDLDSRIAELENSIEIHKKALVRQKLLVQKLYVKKNELDGKLQRELHNYESKYLSTYRNIDTKVATYTERLKGQERLKQMSNEISTLEAEADKLAGKVQKLKRKIEEETSKLTKAEDYIVELEETFLQTMLAVGVPGIGQDYKVHINRKTWDVFVLPHGEDYLRWNFRNAGSGGKKTLFNVCYAIAVHLVAVNNNLPLHSFLIIDTPMKNIGEDVNKDIFENFYNHLYELAKGLLNETQFIIIDKEYISPNTDIDILERYMTPEDKNYPPLISYYRGS